MYYCYTDKKCKKMPEGLKMTARFGGGGHEPQEVGIDKPVEGGGNGGNGGGTSESVSIEDAFGNKFMEVVDLIKPEDITEKCWKGYKKKGMKTMLVKDIQTASKQMKKMKLLMKVINRKRATKKMERWEQSVTKEMDKTKKSVAKQK